jgi:hypothetical protein
MHACMRTYIHTYTHTRIHTHTYAYTHIHTDTHRHAHTYTHLYFILFCIILVLYLPNIYLKHIKSLCDLRLPPGLQYVVIIFGVLLRVVFLWFLTSLLLSTHSWNLAIICSPSSLLLSFSAKTCSPSSQIYFSLSSVPSSFILLFSTTLFHQISVSLQSFCYLITVLPKALFPDWSTPLPGYTYISLCTPVPDVLTGPWRCHEYRSRIVGHKSKKNDAG